MLTPDLLTDDKGNPVGDRRVVDATGTQFIPSTRRADGTWRKEIKCGACCLRVCVWVFVVTDKVGGLTAHCGFVWAGPIAVGTGSARVTCLPKKSRRTCQSLPG